jgi:hypothetical protein
VGVFYAASIPWYRAGGADTGMLFGLPSWVAVAILCYAAAAVANALAWLLTDVPDRPADGGRAGGGAP